MQTKRLITSELAEEIAKGHTEPFKLVRIDFDAAPQYLSEGGTVEFEGNTYVGGGVQVGTFVWTPDLTQVGTVELLNELNAATAIILNNQVLDTPVTIYETYRTDTGFAEPTVIVKGVLDSPTITPTSSTLRVLASTSLSNIVPRRYHTVDEGFNHLPIAGSVISWGGEKFVLEAG